MLVVSMPLNAPWESEPPLIVTAPRLNDWKFPPNDPLPTVKTFVPKVRLAIVAPENAPWPKMRASIATLPKLGYGEKLEPKAPLPTDKTDFPIVTVLKLELLNAPESMIPELMVNSPRSIGSSNVGPANAPEPIVPILLPSVNLSKSVP